MIEREQAEAWRSERKKALERCCVPNWKTLPVSRRLVLGDAQPHRLLQVGANERDGDLVAGGDAQGANLTDAGTIAGKARPARDVAPVRCRTGAG